MSTIELREIVIAKLQNADDRVLNEVLGILEIDANERPYKLTADQKDAIDESQRQIANGEFLTNEEVEKEIEEWLNE